MTSSTVTPENSASASSSSRWLRMGTASSLMSSGTHVAAAVRGGPGLGRADVGQAAADAQPEPDVAQRAGLLGELADVAEDGRVHVHLVGELGHLDDRARGDHVLDGGGAVTGGRGGEQRDGRGMVGVAEAGLHQEPVELRLGQPVGACLLDRVLGGDDHERPADLVGGPVDGDVALLHDLEQGRLGLRRGPVDLVGQHDGGEDRAAVEVEGAGALVVDGDAGDVAGQQVGRELDPAVRALDRVGDRLGQRGLPGAGVVLEQQVPLGQQAGEREPDRRAACRSRPARRWPPACRRRARTTWPGRTSWRCAWVVPLAVAVVTIPRAFSGASPRCCRTWLDRLR